MKAKTTAAKKKRYEGFTEEEKSAMASRVREMKASDQNTEGEVLEKIGEMLPEDRAMAKRIHAIVRGSAPSLSPKLWYGMPAYATEKGKIVLHFQPAQKFKTRYAMVAFQDAAHLDDGELWPVAYALGKLTAADEARLGALVKKAVS
ncbi:MAG TPA: hypothetical protein VHQ03_10030 [Candidatus Dormibacteraeota bacterium]|nr:hypothetical protein [Candidatus Dormibacteraeota bacterium]